LQLVLVEMEQLLTLYPVVAVVVAVIQKPQRHQQVLEQPFGVKYLLEVLVALVMQE